MCFSECVSRFPKKINNQFREEVGSPFVRGKVTIFIGRETKTNILPKNSDEKFLLLSTPLTIIFLLEQLTIQQQR